MLHHHHHSTKTDLSNSHDLQLGEPSPLDPSKGLSGSNGNTSAWKSSVVGDPSPLVGDSSSTGDLTVPITPDTSTASVTVTPSPISSVPPNAVDFNAAPVRSVRSTVGVNLNGIQDYATETPFVDVFKSSRSWISQSDGAPWGQGGSLNLTPDGYIASLKPGQYAETVMLTDSTHFPSGNYTLLYSGDGKITFDSSNATVVSQSPGRMVVNVDKSNPSGVFMAIRETNPDNPIHDIHFVMPGYENTF